MLFSVDDRKGCKNAGRTIVASAEVTDRWNKYDPRIGVCLAVMQTEEGKIHWNTWEYNAEDSDNYFVGHYFMEDQVAAWEDYFSRCSELVDDYKKYHW